MSSGLHGHFIHGSRVPCCYLLLPLYHCIISKTSCPLLLRWCCTIPPCCFLRYTPSPTQNRLGSPRPPLCCYYSLNSLTNVLGCQWRANFCVFFSWGGGVRYDSLFYSLSSIAYVAAALHASVLNLAILVSRGQEPLLECIRSYISTYVSPRLVDSQKSDTPISQLYTANISCLSPYYYYILLFYTLRFLPRKCVVQLFGSKSPITLINHHSIKQPQYDGVFAPWK